jgi:polyphosphate:AMP phosphotransferase
MFESAEQPHSLAKEAYKEEEPELHAELLEVQLKLVQTASFPVIILVSGIDGAGKGKAIHRLYGWLDPRHLQTRAYDGMSDASRARPPMWRYWRDLPPKGRIGIVIGSWYHAPLRNRVEERIDEDAFVRQLEEINRFEEMLASEGALLLKFWFHLSGEQQAKRLKKARRNHRGRHVLNEWTGIEMHGDAVRAAARMTRYTSTGHAPWLVIPGYDHRYRDIAMGRTVLEAISKRLVAPRPVPVPAAPALIPSVDRRTVLDGLDLSQVAARKTYSRQLKAFQERLSDATDDRRFRKTGLIAVFEGVDAAGKGGTIRRFTAALDPRRFQVHPIAAPSDEERAQPYLWRFWRRMPGRGKVGVFDRSWYGRVLVERVEGLASEAEWLRAYSEINDFERQLTDFGIVLVKFWLQISKEEQLARFKAREDTPYKRHKITEEDWRNREKWDDYRLAVGDMIDRTSTESAPWTLVAAEDKRHARLKVLGTVCERLEDALGRLGQD